MTGVQAFLLGGLQGLTEFLPVSSSAHLMMVQHWWQLPADDSIVFFNLVLHLGTLTALFLLLRKQMVALWQKGSLLVWLACAMVPTVILGLLISHWKDVLLHAQWVGAFMIINSAILMFGHKQLQKPLVQRVDTKRSFVVGLAQGLAVVPGISRSGSTITAALVTGVDMAEAFVFSFALSIPTIILAFAYQLWKVKDTFAIGVPVHVLGIGCLSSFVVGLGSLWVVRRLLHKRRLDIFAYYCFTVGLWNLMMVRG